MSGGSPTSLLLASTSPQRRAILAQLGIPFDVVRPRYDEEGTTGADPVELVRAHALGKARSLAGEAAGRPVLGVDTAVLLGEQVFGKPVGESDARVMLARLAGRTHEVVSGLCLIGPGWEELEYEMTRVTFRELAASEIDAYLARSEWRGRAGAYAIQGLGARLVARIEGDYLNVVGLPAALLVSILARRFPGVYGLG
ncbi:MAG: nucleoside triphosphate pyrophosphatase [Gaiellaceae bacterium]